MSAWTSIPLRTSAAYETVAATGELYEPAAGPLLRLHRRRIGLLVHWEITLDGAEPVLGPVFAFGHTWTRDGAFVEAVTAARRRDVVEQAEAAGHG